MTNGFYNTDNLSVTTVKRFCNDAIKLAYTVNCQTLVGWQRQITKTLSIKKFIEDALTQPTSTSSLASYSLYVVDRYEHRQKQIPKELSDFEICLTYNSNYLYIFVNEDNFNILIKKYHLKLKEW